DRRPDLLAGRREPFRALATEQRLELGKRGPVALDEAAVAAARPGAAERGLEHDDVRRRRTFEHAERRPQAGVAAADDRDVGPRVAVQHRRVDAAAFGRERLLEPPRRRGPGRDRRFHPDRLQARASAAGFSSSPNFARLTNWPMPGFATSVSPSTSTLPRSSTVSGDPCTSVPSNRL